MKKILFLSLSLSLIGIFLGCEAMQYQSQRRQRRRQHAIETDLSHMSDDIDWVLGIARPSRLYDQTLR